MLGFGDYKTLVSKCVRNLAELEVKNSIGFIVCISIVRRNMTLEGQ